MRLSRAGWGPFWTHLACERGVRCDDMGMLKPKIAVALALISICRVARGEVDTSAMDLSVKPQDNFYLYANGTWLKNNPIPPEFTWWGTAPEIRDRNVANMNTICVAAAAMGAAGSDVERMVGDYYASGMDEAAVNA